MYNLKYNTPKNILQFFKIDRTIIIILSLKLYQENLKKNLVGYEKVKKTCKSFSVPIKNKLKELVKMENNFQKLFLRK